MKRLVLFIVLISVLNCKPEIKDKEDVTIEMITESDFTISVEKYHNRFSNVTPSQINVLNGSVVEAYTQDANGDSLI